MLQGRNGYREGNRVEAPRDLGRAPAATGGALSGPTMMNAAPGRVDLHPTTLDRFPLRKAVYSTGPRSLPANCRHTPVRYTRVRSGGEARAGPQPQNRVCLAPLQCSQHDREAPETLSESHLEQGLPVLDSSGRPVRENVYGSPAHHVVLKRTLNTSAP